MIGILGLEIHLYGLMVGFGLLAGGWVAAKIAKREGLDPGVVWDGLLWAMMAGIVGARLYHVADLWSYYSRHLAEIVMVCNGGLGIFGGVIGGIVGLILYVKLNQKSNIKYQKSLLKLFDLGALGIPLSQAIGRWGNFFNQELYGRPTSLPWGVVINPENRLPGFEQFSRFQPLFLYESLLNLGLFGLLLMAYSLWQKRSDWKAGSMKYVGMYLAGYGVIRFVLEPLRIDYWRVGVIPTAWIFSVVVMLWGAWLL